jgi:hypothetical protein
MTELMGLGSTLKQPAFGKRSVVFIVMHWLVLPAIMHDYVAMERAD